jgi:hypothetical protein
MDEALNKGEAPMTTEGRSHSGQASRLAPAAQATDLSSLMVTHAGMNAALGNGDAVLLGQALDWVSRYEGSWWVECEHGWLRVIDGGAARDLEQLAARLAETGPVAQDNTPGASPGCRTPRARSRMAGPGARPD